MPDYWHDHIHLISPDPLNTSQFYERMFNAKRVSTRELADGRTSVVLDLNGARVLVTQRQAQPEPAPTQSMAGYGLEHFGLRTDNLEAANVVLIEPNIIGNIDVSGNITIGGNLKVINNSDFN